MEREVAVDDGRRERKVKCRGCICQDGGDVLVWREVGDDGASVPDLDRESLCCRHCRRWAALHGRRRAMFFNGDRIQQWRVGDRQALLPCGLEHCLMNLLNYIYLLGVWMLLDDCIFSHHCIWCL